MDFIRQLAKHSAIYSVADIAAKGVGFFLIPLYTHYLTPEDYGVLEILFVTQSILVVLTSQGLGSGIFKFFSDAKSFDERAKTFSSIIYYIAVISTVTCGLGLLFSSKISYAIFKNSSYSNLVRYLFICYFFNLNILLSKQTLRAELRSTLISTISFCRFLIAVFFNIYFIVFCKFGINGIIYSEMISSSFIAAIYFAFTHKYWKLNFDLQILKKILKFSIPLIGVGLSSWILTVSDRYFLSLLSTKQELGQYSLAYKFTGIMSIGVLQPFLSAWPSIYFKAAKDKNSAIFFYKVIHLYIICSSAFGVMLLCLSDIAITIMSPPSFWKAKLVLAILIMSIIFEGLNAIFVSGMYIVEKTIVPPIITIIAALSNILLNCIFIPKYGMEGAAWATLISYFLMATLSYRIGNKYYPLRMPYKSIFYSIFMYILGVLGYTLLKSPNNIVYNMMLLITEGIFITSFSFILLLSDEERRWILSLPKKCYLLLNS